MEIHNFQNNPPGSSTNSNISRSFKLAVILVNISICNRNQFWKSISLPLKLNICWKNRTMQGSEHVTENDILNAYLDDGDGPHSDAFYHIPLWREFIDSHIYQIEKCAHNSWLLFEHQFHHSLGKENCKAINMRKMCIAQRHYSIEITMKFIQCVYAISQLIFLQRLHYSIVQISQTFFANMKYFNFFL